MSVAGVALLAIFGWGVLGIFSIRPVLAEGADETVDHPRLSTRCWYRFWALGICFFLSFMVSPAVIVQWLPEIDLRDQPELVRVCAVLLYPVPLAALFFWLFIKASRWTARIIRGRQR
jgi:hypothetical protein